MFVVPEAFRYKMLMLIFGDFIATYVFENFVAKFLSSYEQKRQDRLKHTKMIEDIKEAKPLLNDVKEPVSVYKIDETFALKKDQFVSEGEFDEPPMSERQPNEKPHIGRSQFKSPSNHAQAVYDEIEEETGRRNH